VYRRLRLLVPSPSAAVEAVWLPLEGEEAVVALFLQLPTGNRFEVMGYRWTERRQPFDKLRVKRQ
jgi:hypothetical protein